MESDEFAMVMLFFVFALIFGYIFWILMFVVPWLYFKSKKKYPRGFLKHFLYKMGLINFQGAPNFFEKKFNE
jgi:hypothetical protein